MRKYYLVILSILCVGVVTNINANTDFCRQCFHQKEVLWGQCIRNPQLALLYPNWCLRQLHTMKLMHSVAPEADKILNNRKLRRNKVKYFWVNVRPGTTPRLPFDYCDACINNMAFVRAQCFNGKPEPSPPGLCSSQYVKFFEDVKISVIYADDPSFLAQTIP